MGEIDLSDILITPLCRMETNGGDVLHGMKCEDQGYVGFGEIYFSWILPGAVKAWKRHIKMTMNIVVPVGQVRFVFRSISNSGVEKFRIEEVGVDRYVRITVPPGIWFGFQGLGNSQGLIANVANIAHDPSEVERQKLNDIGYEWNNL